MQLQHELFERMMNSRKKITDRVAPIKMDSTSWAKAVVLRLSFLEDDPLFSKFEPRFAAHLKYPFTQCEFSLLCKPTRKSRIRIKSPKPISTIRFNFEAQMWKLSVYDDNDYAVKKAIFPAESPDILFAALANHWRIENLRAFPLQVDGASQMKLL